MAKKRRCELTERGVVFADVARRVGEDNITICCPHFSRVTSRQARKLGKWLVATADEIDAERKEK